MANDAALARILQSPLAIATWLLVMFEVLSLTLRMIDLWPAWSNGRSNLGALTGKRCGLADYVMVEQNPNDGMLTPVGAPAGDALGATTTEGFGPNNIPTNLSADEVTGGGPGTSSNFADTAQATKTRQSQRAPKAAPRRGRESTDPARDCRSTSTLPARR